MALIFVYFFVIRLIVGFAVLVILLMMFTSFESIVTTNEQERSLNNLAQSLFESDLTVGYAVFDSSRLTDISTAVTHLDPGTEPVRFCGRGAFFEIFQYDEGEEEMVKKWEFGYKPRFPSQVATREYITWIQERDVRIASKARITLYGAESTFAEPLIGGVASLPITKTTHTIPLGVASLGCAVERAWFYKTVHAADYSCGRECNFQLDGDNFCAFNDRGLEACRKLPEIVKSVSLQPSDVQPIAITTFHAIPIKKGSAASCKNPEITGQDDEVDTVILCPKSTRIVVIKA